MEALTEALLPAITDIEVSWHLPEGYDVIQTPQLLPFVQSNQRLVIYGILYRPPSEEKESPRTPSKRKMDWSMRSFSNSSVKVFWFEDECDLLSEDQLLAEAEDEELRPSEDDFEEDAEEGTFIEQEGFDTTMERVPESETIEAMADGLLRHISDVYNEETLGETTAPSVQVENDQSCELHEMLSEEERFDRTGIPSPTPCAGKEKENNNTKYSKNFKPPCSPMKDDLAFELNFGAFFNDIKQEFEESEDLQRSSDSQEQHGQRLPKLVRAHERDSGVGFSIDENDKSPDESKKDMAEMESAVNEEPKDWSRDSKSPASDKFDQERESAVRIYKSSEFLSQLGVPADFGAVNIRGYVGEEEVEQVIPFPVNRSGGSSKRPTIHQLLARSLIRELQASLDSHNSDSIEIIKRISQLSGVHCRHTARVARDQYCYDDQVLSALQFPQKEAISGLGNRKVYVPERSFGLTEGLGRRLPSPDGSDHDLSPYLAEGGNDLTVGSGEEPVDFYRLERTGTPESQSEDAGSRKDADSFTNSPSKSPRKHIPPLSTRCVLGERQQTPSKFRAKLLTSTNSLDSYLEAGTRKHLSFVRMISLQSAQGSWNLDCSFAEVLGFPLPDIQASSPLADNSVYIAEDLRELMNSDKCDNSSQLWATALALSWFHRKRSQFQAEWTLSVKKAEEWMDRAPCPRGFLSEDLKTLAYQALLLLETETRRARSASVDATPRNKEDECD